jgi:hypothetical protein
MSRKSVCQVAHSWVDVGSSHTRLMARFTIFTASVRNNFESPSYVHEHVFSEYLKVSKHLKPTALHKMQFFTIHVKRPQEILQESYSLQDMFCWPCTSTYMYNETNLMVLIISSPILNQANWQSTKTYNTHYLLKNTYIVTSWWWATSKPKHVEV